MASTTAGSLYLFDGTTLQCNTNQVARELFFDAQSGMLRYKRQDGIIEYINTSVDTATLNTYIANVSGQLDTRINNSGANLGVGTSGYISRYVSASGFGNSIIYNDGVYVGIGYTDSKEALSVSGNIMFKNGAYIMASGYGSLGQRIIGTGSSRTNIHGQSGFVFIPDLPGTNTSRVFIDSTGNMYIGSHVAGQAKLAINGGVHVGGPSDPGDNNLAVDGSGSFGTTLLTGKDLYVTETGYFTKDVNISNELYVNGEGIVITRPGAGAGYINFASGTVTDWRIARNPTGTTPQLRLNANNQAGRYFYISKAYDSNPILTVNMDDSRVGINTINPLDKFDVNGNIRGSGTLILASGVDPSTEGALYRDNVTKGYGAFSNGIHGHFNKTIYVNLSTSGVANSTTETSIVPVGGTGSVSLMPVKFFSIGKRLKFRILGVFNTKSPTPGTITINIKLGTTVICTTGAFTPSAGNTNSYWQMDGSITCSDTGATGHVGCTSAFLFQDISAGTDPMKCAPMIGSSTVINTTTTQQFDCTATFGTANASNNLTCTSFILEEIN